MRWVSGGANAKVVMSGAGGNKRKQAWPPVTPSEVSVSFSDNTSFEKLPMSIFDPRTDAASLLRPATIFANRWSPQSNLAATYEFRLLDQILDGATTVVETVIPSGSKSLALPSTLILAATLDDANEVIGVDYGNNGFRIFSMLAGATRYEYFINYALGNGFIVRVEKFLSWIQVFVNGVRIGATTHPTFNLAGAPGVGVYSNAAPNISTPVGSTVIQGSSSTPRLLRAKASFERKTLVQSEETVVATIYIDTARRARAVTRNAGWTNYAFLPNRRFTLYLNDKSIGNMGDQNGTTLLTSSPFDIPAKSILEVKALSVEAAEKDRVIKSGTIEINSV